MDITCKDECVRLAVYHFMLTGCVECVWKTVLKHPGQFRIFQFGFCRLDCLFDGGRSKLAFFRCRTLASVL